MGAADAAKFPPTARLRNPREFEAVLKGGQRVQEQWLTCAARATQEPARLGLAISAKAVPASTHRNRIRRQIRESFRRHRAELPRVDIVLLARAGAAKAANPELRAGLERLWQKLRDKYEQAPGN